MHIQVFLAFCTFTLVGIAWYQSCQVKQSMEVSNKAYISVDEVSEMTPSASNLELFNAKIVFINTGQTPAYDIKVRAKLEISRDESLLRNVEDIPLLKMAEILGKEKQTQPYYFNLDKIASDTSAMLLSKEMFIFLHGRLTYTDIFKSDRFLNFRYYFRTDGTTRDTAFGFAKNGNGADDN